MKRIFLSSVLIFLTALGFAQNEADALRYSSQYNFGTARYTGLGGAMGALGGDMSSIHSNPAGIGVYRFGDISFTPALEINDLKTTLNGLTMSQDKSTLVINNIGFVLANETNDPHWKTVNFGVSYNRLNTFNDHLNISSVNDVSNSLMEDFAWEANGIAPDDLSGFSAGLAWNGYVIDQLDTVYHVYGGRAFQGDMKQVQDSESSGRLGETTLTLGANYDDILYLGASINFLLPEYTSITKTTETPLEKNHTDLVSYTFSEHLNTTGVGVNLRLGGIVKAGKYLRFGGSVQTPTSLQLTDEYQTKLVSHLRSPNEKMDLKSKLSVFEYRVRTPWRFMASVAGVLGSKAIVSFQYEFTDLSSARLKSSKEIDVDFSDSNDLIRTMFTSSNIFRGGIEYRLTPELYARGGVSYFTNPNKANEFTSANLNRFHYAGGVGYRTAAWSLDLSYQLAKYQELYKTHNSGNIATITDSRSSIIATVSFRL